ELTVRDYYRNFYRPALAQQPEWTFPATDGYPPDHPLFPETTALMRVIDTLRPRFLCSLHNSASGGAFLVLSRLVPELAEALPAIASRHGVPLASQPTDCIRWPKVAHGVWLMPPIESVIPTKTANPGPRRHGASSAH